MRRLIVFCSAVAIVLSISSLASAQTDIVRIIYYPPWNISKLPMYLARDEGIFDRNGLKVTWTNPGSNEKLLAGLKNGDADIAVASANHIVHNNASGGTLMRLVGNTGFNYSAFFTVASVKNAADLKGKNIGSGEPGSTPDQLTRLALRRLGLDPEKDVTLVHFDEGRNTDRVKNLLDGKVAGMVVTAEAMYQLEKAGKLSLLNKLTDHKQLKIYAGGGADYAIAATFLKNRRDDAKRFMTSICEGIAVARKDTAKAHAFIAKSGRNLDGAVIDYLYRLYINEVIPARPHVKLEGVELAIQMTAALIPSAGGLKAPDVSDLTLVPELEKEGRCNL